MADSDEEDCDNKLDKIEAQATREGAYTFDEVDDWLIVEGEEEEDKEDKEDGHGCNNTDFESDDSVDELGIRRGPVPYEQRSQILTKVSMVFNNDIILLIILFLFYILLIT